MDKSSYHFYNQSYSIMGNDRSQPVVGICFVSQILMFSNLQPRSSKAEVEEANNKKINKCCKLSKKHLEIVHSMVS